VLSQYGLKREEAYRYSVSRAAALGPNAVHEPEGQRHLFARGQEMPRGQDRPEFRARRDGSPEFDEGGDLPFSTSSWPR
jgi:hypothetical protein